MHVMFTIELSQLGSHDIFTQEEADERGKKYIYWREAEAGDWALSDNGYVAEVLRKYKWDYKGYPSVSIRTAAGSWNAERPMEMIIDPNEERTNWAFSKDVTASRFGKGGKFVLLAKFFACTLDWGKSWEAVFGRELLRMTTINRLLSSEEFRLVLAKELEKVFDDNGLSREYLAKQLADMCKDQKNPKRFDAIKFAMEIRNMVPDASLKTPQLSRGIFGELGMGTQPIGELMPEKPGNGKYDDAEDATVVNETPLEG